LTAPVEFARLTTERVPAEHRTWVEQAIATPVNRVLAPLAAFMRRVMLAQLNVQIIQYRGLPPSSTEPLERALTVAGPCLGVVALGAKLLDSAGAEGNPVGTGVEGDGGLTVPAWREVISADRGGRLLRITAQAGLTPGLKYSVTWLAVGG
jgi:hypothetical protein